MARAYGVKNKKEQTLGELAERRDQVEVTESQDGGGCRHWDLGDVPRCGEIIKTVPKEREE